MEELNVPGYHKVVADKANVPVEYAARVINDFVRANDPDEDEFSDFNDDEQGVAEGLGYSQDPEQAKWYHEGRKAFEFGTISDTGLIQDIARKHNCPPEYLDAFRAGYQDQEDFSKDEMAEGDNLATFEQDGCNQTMEGQYCLEHGLAECGGMYESQLARIKSLAYGR